jgi:hypothetical protein
MLDAGYWTCLPSGRCVGVGAEPTIGFHNFTHYSLLCKALIRCNRVGCE